MGLTRWTETATESKALSRPCVPETWQGVGARTVAETSGPMGAATPVNWISRGAVCRDEGKCQGAVRAAGGGLSTIVPRASLRMDATRMVRAAGGRFSTIVSIRPEGRQVQHPGDSSPDEGNGDVSIRPEGRQVQHQIRLDAVASVGDVSIRPEGRQVQHRRVLQRPQGRLEGLNPSRRTAGSAPQ